MSKIDFSYLNSLTEGDSELIQDLVDVFKIQVPEYLLNLKKTIDEENTEMLERIVHKAKSSVQVFGLEELAKKLNEIEIDISESNGTFKESYTSILPYFEKETQQALKDLEELGY